MVVQPSPVHQHKETKHLCSFRNKALGISSGIDDMGEVKWDMCLCLLFAWIVVYLCICKGIKSSGKVFKI
jgi:hypothetical protein